MIIYHCEIVKLIFSIIDTSVEMKSSPLDYNMNILQFAPPFSLLMFLKSVRLAQSLVFYVCSLDLF